MTRCQECGSPCIVTKGEELMGLGVGILYVCTNFDCGEVVESEGLIVQSYVDKIDVGYQELRIN